MPLLSPPCSIACCIMATYSSAVRAAGEPRPKSPRTRLCELQIKPKRKPGKNRPASSRRLIQGPQLRDFTKESLKFLQGTSKLIVLAELWGCPKTATIYFRKAKSTQTGAQPGDAVGRLTRELSLSDPRAKFFREKREQTQKRRTLRPTGQ